MPRSYIHPPALNSGDTVGFSCPASPITFEQAQQSANRFEQMGFQCRLGDSLTESYLCDLAGTDQQRLHDLRRMMNCPEVKAIAAFGEGYGTLRLLEEIDYQELAHSPKWLIGRGDITCLHSALFIKTGLITLYGPAHGAFEFPREPNPGTPPKPSRQITMINLLQGRGTPGTFDFNTNDFQTRAKQTNGESSETWVPGTAQGYLMGGNLTRLASLAGTPYALPQNLDLILYIEEAGEEAYRVDRLLTQLRQSGAFKAVKGILVGPHVPPPDMPENRPYIINSLKERLTGLGVPVLAALATSHPGTIFLAHGAKVALDAEQQQLHYLEAITA